MTAVEQQPAGAVDAPPMDARRARTRAAVLAVYESAPGQWMGSGEVADVAGVARSTAGKRAAELVAEGVLQHNGLPRQHRQFRTPPPPGAAVELPTSRRPAGSVPPDEDPRAAGDQYEGRGLDELVAMCDERGVVLTPDEELDIAKVRARLRDHTASTQTPGLHEAGAPRQHLGRKRQLSDEERRRQGIERQILAECADVPCRPVDVARSLFRNGPEVRGFMLDLCHRGRLVSTDGYATFRTVGP